MPRRKQAAPPSEGLSFVISTDLSKADPSTRKLIRSHVMRGKNAGRILPPRKKRHVQHANSDDTDVDDVALIRAGTSLALVPASRRFGGRFSTLALADDVPAPRIDSILHFSTVAKQLLFPLEPCIFFERRAEEWIGPLTTDPAYLHCLIFTSQYFFDAKESGLKGNAVPLNHATMSHFIKGLRMLGDRMSNENDEMRLSNSTAAAVMGLSAHALVTDDLQFAKKHVEGLTKIVELRGGVSSFFGGSEKLLVEVLRSDIGYALAQGSTPMFLNVLETDPLYEFPRLDIFLEPNGLVAARRIPPFLTNVNHDLIEVWMFMSNFTTLMNFASYTSHKISTPMFLHVTTAVMYRLMSMDFVNDRSNEVVRLGLLAFSSSALLQWRTIGMKYTALVQKFKDHFSMVDAFGLSPEFALWSMTIGAIALLEPSDDSWLAPLFQKYLRMSELNEWQDLLELMDGIMWINLIHDKEGKAVFSRLSASGQP